MRWLCMRRRSPVASARRDHALAVAAEVLAHLAREVARVDRLLDEAVAADGEARLAIALGGDGDDRHAVERRLAAQAQRHLVAVEARDVQVDEHEIGPLREIARRTPFEAVGGVDHLVPVGREELADEEPVPRVVLDVQHARHRLAEMHRDALLPPGEY